MFPHRQWLVAPIEPESLSLPQRSRGRESLTQVLKSHTARSVVRELLERNLIESNRSIRMTKDRVVILGSNSHVILIHDLTNFMIV